MKLVALALFAAAGLVGCGTFAPNDAAPGWQDAAAPQLDAERMAAINHVAAKRGVTVVWVNPPRKAAGT